MAIVGLAGAALLIGSKVNLGFDAGALFFEVIGLVGFILWLVFIASTSVWLLRRDGEPVEPQAMREHAPV